MASGDRTARRSESAGPDGAAGERAAREGETPPGGPIDHRTGIDVMGVPFAARDIRDATLIKHGEIFLLTDLEGNVPLGNPSGFGLYQRDTRYLSGYELVIEGLKPTVLLSTGNAHFLGAHVLANPSLVIDGRFVPEQTVHVRRYRIVRGAGASESLTFENYNGFSLVLHVGFRLEADFADVFRVRGLRLDGDGPPVVPTYDGGLLTFRRTGRDGVERIARIRFDPPPAAAAGGTLSYVVALPERGSLRIAVTMELADQKDGARASAGAPARRTPPESEAWLAERAAIETDSALFDAVLEQARRDLRMLLGDHQGRPYIAAGIPWYATLFGRDTLVTALSDGWLCPPLARHTLRLLAELQGRRDDPWRDEEPGKILHELRRGELTAAGLVPFSPYYGTVDATPLWVMLLGEHYRSTGDLELVRELRPHLEAALAWIARAGDGFVTYARRSGEGLRNQGWKDSWDGIPHADGSLPEPPIALVEVQAYAFSAKRRAAELFRALGEPERAARLVAEASALRARFEEAFWMPDEGFYCLALDGKGQQIASIASNPGHALFCGIVARERAEAVARRLLGEDMFSGWGVRTLSSRSRSYNPSGYHLGTVWPHDNALLGLGLKRYGHEALLDRLVSGLFDAARQFPSYRMPELFCGFDRSAFGLPVRYPVACSPQAWAAASWSALVRAMLGLEVDAPARELRVARPTLPAWLGWLTLRRLRVGDAEVDLRYQRIGDHTAVDVEAMRGDVRVTLVGSWADEERG